MCLVHSLHKCNLVNSDLDFPTATQFSDKANYFPRAVRKFNHLYVACKHGRSAIALFAHIYVTRGHELIGYVIPGAVNIIRNNFAQLVSLFKSYYFEWYKFKDY